MKELNLKKIQNKLRNKFLKIGRTKGFIDNIEGLSSLDLKNNLLDQIIKFKKILIPIILVSIIALISYFTLL